MKIIDLHATPVNIPFVAPYRFSYGSMASVTKTVVEVVTDEGAVGLGEVADGDRSADALRQRDKIIGLDVRDIHTAERRIVPAMRYTPWGNILAQRRVFGRHRDGDVGRPWAERGRVAGAVAGRRGAQRDRADRVFQLSPARHQPSRRGDRHRYCALLPRMIELHEADEGKLATVSLDEEVRMVREVRAAIGDRMLRLDANGAWTVPTAREALRRLDPFVIHYYEDPVETYEEIAELRGATRAPFCTHVIDLLKAARLRAPDAIVTNLNELGGIRRTVDFIRACETFDVAFRFHAGETGSGSAAE